jgi:hypothetical protein
VASAGLGRGIQSTPFAWKGHGQTDLEPGGSGQDDGEELGDTVDRQPAGKLEGETLGCEHGHHGSQTGAIHGDQHGRGNAEGKSQGKGEQGDLSVVGEQKCGKDRETVLFSIVIKGRPQGLGAGGRISSARHVFTDDGVEPLGVAADQRISDQNPQDQYGCRG